MSYLLNHQILDVYPTNVIRYLVWKCPCIQLLFALFNLIWLSISISYTDKIYIWFGILFVQYHKKLTLTQRISLCRNNNIRSRQKLNHPKKQPIVNLRRLNDEQQKMYSNLSIDERHKQKRAGAGGFLNESKWKRKKSAVDIFLSTQWRVCS